MGRRPRRVTSKDVARLAGVSRTTVSLVLNDVPHARIAPETRRRVLEAARQLGYRPNAAARSLVRQQAMTLGLILCHPPAHVYTDPFLPQVLLGITGALQKTEYRLLLETVAEPSLREDYLDLAREKRIDGFILSGPRVDDVALRELHKEGIPIVLLGHLPDVAIPSVDVDNVRAAYTAVTHLIRLGHRRIGMITNGPLHYTASQERLNGYRQGLAKYNIPFEPDLVVEGHFTAESGEEAMRRLLTVRPRPTAVFVASDTVALGALVTLRQAGIRVPEDMALVGFDDIPLAAYVDPPLTTVRLPAYELGREAARLLLTLVAGESPPSSRTVLSTALVVRASCGALQALHNPQSKGGETGSNT